MKLDPKKAILLRNALNKLNHKPNVIDYKGHTIQYKITYSLRRKVEFNCYIEPIDVENNSTRFVYFNNKIIRDNFLRDVVKVKFNYDTRILGIQGNLKLVNVFIKNGKLLKDGV
jgi:hypothetical protein